MLLTASRLFFKASIRLTTLGGASTVGAVTAALASFLPWVGTDIEDGGTTSLTGWGSIAGTSSIAGTNLNDVMDSWTYRPGLIGLITSRL